MAYTVRNTSNDIYLFNINHNDNFAEVFTLKPGEYVSSDKLGGNFFISDTLESQRLIRDIFKSSGEGKLAVTDADGNAVTYDDYKTANP